MPDTSPNLRALVLVAAIAECGEHAGDVARRAADNARERGVVWLRLADDRFRELFQLIKAHSDPTAATITGGGEFAPRTAVHEFCRKSAGARRERRVLRFRMGGAPEQRQSMRGTWLDQRRQEDGVRANANTVARERCCAGFGEMREIFFRAIQRASVFNQPKR